MAGWRYAPDIGLDNQVIDGNGVFLLPPGMPIPEEIALGLLMHNIKEFQHLAKILPDVYRENKDKWL